MTKAKLFCDYDGTIVNSPKAYYSVYENMFRNHKDFRPANPNDCVKWNLEDVAPLAKDISEDIFSSKELFDYLEPFPNAIEVLTRLEEKYQIIIVSIGSYSNISYKSKWIETNLPFIDDFIGIVNRNIVMDKSCINMKGTDDKPNVFIDDSASNLLSVQSTNLIRYCYGDKRTEWNSKWLDINGRQLRNWLEVEKELMKENKKY
jgi:5'(3')-deoxyribonucleotidase